MFYKIEGHLMFLMNLIKYINRPIEMYLKLYDTSRVIRVIPKFGAFQLCPGFQCFKRTNQISQIHDKKQFDIIDIIISQLSREESHNGVRKIRKSVKLIFDPIGPLTVHHNASILYIVLKQSKEIKQDIESLPSVDNWRIQRTRNESVTFLLFLESEHYCKLMTANVHRCMRLAYVSRK